VAEHAGDGGGSPGVAHAQLVDEESSYGSRIDAFGPKCHGIVPVSSWEGGNQQEMRLQPQLQSMHEKDAALLEPARAQPVEEGLVDSSINLPWTCLKMGKKRISMERIADKQKRHVTFSKRRNDLFKKAEEVCSLTGATIAIICLGRCHHAADFLLLILRLIVIGRSPHSSSCDFAVLWQIESVVEKDAGRVGPRRATDRAKLKKFDSFNVNFFFSCAHPEHGPGGTPLPPPLLPPSLISSHSQPWTCLEMGKKRISMERIADKQKRHVTFSKRRNDLFKKAEEVCSLSSATIAIICFREAGNPFTFCHPPPADGHQQFLSIMQQYYGSSSGCTIIVAPSQSAPVGRGGGRIFSKVGP
ncbi:Serum response factor-like protein B, partial [Nymphaea thermarum]